MCGRCCYYAFYLFLVMILRKPQCFQWNNKRKKIHERQIPGNALSICFLYAMKWKILCEAENRFADVSNHLTDLRFLNIPLCSNFLGSFMKISQAFRLMRNSNSDYIQLFVSCQQQTRTFYPLQKLSLKTHESQNIKFYANVTSCVT